MEYLLIFISAIFVNNIVLSQFLGICPFLGVSKKIDTAIGMGGAIAFVLTLATIITWCVQKQRQMCIRDRITTNCAVLGVAILVIQKDFNLLESVVYAFSTALGFALTLIVFAGIREQQALVRIPKGMQGMAIVLITASLLSLAFMGFSGVDVGPVSYTKLTMPTILNV